MVPERKITPSAPPLGPHPMVGRSVPKIDSSEKAAGVTKYVGDMQMVGMLHARILWAGSPHAIIRGIDTAKAKSMPGVRAVLTSADLPGVNRYGLAVQDQRVLADDKVRTAADPVALVAAETAEEAEEALLGGGDAVAAAHGEAQHERLVLDHHAASEQDVDVVVRLEVGRAVEDVDARQVEIGVLDELDD